MKEVLLIDGRNFVYRNGYTRVGLQSEGRPTGAIYGCLSALIRLARLFPGVAIVFCWDGKNTDKSWRNKLAKDYKGNRKAAPGTAIPIQVLNIRKQIPIITDFMHMFGFKNYSVDTIEADDLIGILATELKHTYDKINIYSTDKDFYQLIKGNVAVIRDLDKSSQCKEVTAKEIKKRWKVSPKQWLHYRSLVGEATDNIAKPIPGVGPVKAIKMLGEGVDPSSDTPHPKYVEHWEAIRLCYRLTKIVRKAHDKRIPVKAQKALKSILKEAKKGKLYRTKTDKTYKTMLAFLKEYELSDIIERRDQLWQIK